jgi:hypothetical protein
MTETKKNRKASISKQEKLGQKSEKKIKGNKVRKEKDPWIT